MDHTRNRQLARIHALARDLGLSKEAYRNVCASLTGKRSAGDMEPHELEQVIAFLSDQRRPTVTREDVNRILRRTA